MTETAELVRDGWYQVVTVFPEALTTVAYRYESGGWWVPDPAFNEASLVGATITPLYSQAEVEEQIVWLESVESVLWDKRDDAYFLGKHDGVSAALHRIKSRMRPVGGTE